MTDLLQDSNARALLQVLGGHVPLLDARIGAQGAREGCAPRPEAGIQGNPENGEIEKGIGLVGELQGLDAAAYLTQAGRIHLVPTLHKQPSISGLA